MWGVFIEPQKAALDAIRGKIQPSSGSVRNDCDTAICNSCNCNCDDTYGKRAQQLLRGRRVLT